jgi:hypothetical protein
MTKYEVMFLIADAIAAVSIVLLVFCVYIAVNG